MANAHPAYRSGPCRRASAQLQIASEVQVATPWLQASRPQQWLVHVVPAPAEIPLSQASSPSQVTVQVDAVPQSAPLWHAR